jgi:hypothetical protein
LADGFKFDFPDWAAAANDLCRRWREAQHRETPGRRAGVALPTSLVDAAK